MGNQTSDGLWTSCWEEDGVWNGQKYSIAYHIPTTIYNTFSVPNECPMMAEMVFNGHSRYIFEVDAKHTQITITHYDGKKKTEPIKDLADLDRYIYHAIVYQASLGSFSLLRDGNDAVIVQAMLLGFSIRKPITHREVKFEKGDFQNGKCVLLYYRSNIKDFFVAVEKKCVF